ncbi:phage tail sheath C-terminal domain-containing protein [Maribacter algicola]|uniref:phage tail sheath C-terminal domain-containing protein n=1 Tax=Maribacter algicola TaxID=2498892 RepID=UPI001FB1FD4A|nr:phage tail sheath C-terminal domain-containing protein [Maribacter algicola]
MYIEELNAFPGTVVEVATAVPAFIGYTEKASDNGKSLLNRPVRINTMQEFHERFGMAFSPKFKLTRTTDKLTDSSPPHHMNIGQNQNLTIEFETDNHDLIFYNSLRLFYLNGGSACYIVSVGLFDANDGVKIDGSELVSGLEPLRKEQEPTMIIIPEAVKLGEKCYDLYKQALKHCSDMQSRFAIVDVFDGDWSEFKGGDNPKVQVFREKIGSEFLDYAAAYYPWLHTNIVSDREVTFMNFGKTAGEALNKLKELMPDEEKTALDIIETYPKEDSEIQTKFNEQKSEDEKAEFEKLDEKSKKKHLEKYTKKLQNNLHLGLWETSPTYKNILSKLREVLNLLPPSAALAGVYTKVDQNRGVWKSPANISLNGVIKPSTTISHEDQELLNVDAIGGKSINAIRTFPGLGTLVWGGRTLDGNSLDWRYINVRRTMIMLEQSIKLALRAYVFEPNDANTWVTVKSMITNFLTDKWKQGALAGASPEDAFEVQIGLGTTMTSVDILEGRMLITIKLAIVGPAEFIVVTFKQQMQKS